MHSVRAAIRSRALYLAPAVLACGVVAGGRSTKACAVPESDPQQLPSVPVEKLACHIRAQSPSAAGRNATPCVLLACGSFNPVTVMHLRMFEAARDELVQKGFDVLGGYISPVHIAYGKDGLAPNSQRVDMARAAVANSDWIMVDDWETAQASYTRTLPALQSLRTRLLSELGVSAEDPLAPKVFLLCGEDLLQSFSSTGVWAEKDIDGIFGDFGVVCISRPGSNALEQAVQPEGTLSKYRDNLHIVRDVVDNPLSSTAVRRAVQEGRSLKYMIPDGVIRLIQEHGLYR